MNPSPSLGTQIIRNHPMLYVLLAIVIALIITMSLTQNRAATKLQHWGKSSAQVHHEYSASTKVLTPYLTVTSTALYPSQVPTKQQIIGVSVVGDTLQIELLPASVTTRKPNSMEKIAGTEHIERFTSGSLSLLGSNGKFYKKVTITQQGKLEVFSLTTIPGTTLLRLARDTQTSDSYIPTDPVTYPVSIGYIPDETSESPDNRGFTTVDSSEDSSKIIERIQAKLPRIPISAIKTVN